MITAFARAMSESSPGRFTCLPCLTDTSLPVEPLKHDLFGAQTHGPL